VVGRVMVAVNFTSSASGSPERFITRLHITSLTRFHFTGLSKLTCYCRFDNSFPPSHPIFIVSSLIHHLFFSDTPRLPDFIFRIAPLPDFRHGIFVLPSSHYQHQYITPVSMSADEASSASMSKPAKRTLAEADSESAAGGSSTKRTKYASSSCTLLQ